MNTIRRLPAGIILAGGKSSRMGLDKTSLRLDGKTLLERTVDVLSGIFDEVLVVADRANRWACARQVRAVTDIVPGIGPLGGIYTGLEATGSASAFVVACDMPQLAARVIAKQLDVWCRTGADALVPVVGGRPEPLHAIYSKKCLPAIKRQIERGAYRVRDLLALVAAELWEPDPEDLASFANVNTPEEWAAFAETGGGDEC